MGDEQVLTIFYGGLAAATLVVLIAASLLLIIRSVAASIRELAGSALGTAEQIVSNTKPIWKLHAVAGVANRILATAGSIGGRAQAIAVAATRERPR